MTEQEIRDRTMLLMDAYRELTDDHCEPTIPEFLQLRAAAIGELRASPAAAKQRCSEPGPASAPQKPRKTAEEKKAPPTKEVSEHAVRMQTVKTQAPPQPAMQTVPETGQEEPESEFDILRRIKDPWN